MKASRGHGETQEPPGCQGPGTCLPGVGTQESGLPGSDPHPWLPGKPADRVCIVTAAGAQLPQTEGREALREAGHHGERRLGCCPWGADASASKQVAAGLYPSRAAPDEGLAFLDGRRRWEEEGTHCIICCQSQRPFLPCGGQGTGTEEDRAWVCGQPAGHQQHRRTRSAMMFPNSTREPGPLPRSQRHSGDPCA